jgi:hypothetical protein
LLKNSVFWEISLVSGCCFGLILFESAVARWFGGFVGLLAARFGLLSALKARLRLGLTRPVGRAALAA